MKIFNLILLFLTAGAAFAAEPESGSEVGFVRIHEAWIREAPPVSKTSAAYMVVENTGAESLQLSGVESPDFEMSMLHVTLVEDGVARMAHRDSVDIPPGERVAFEPGGLHIMLMGRRRPLEAGEQVELHLGFKDKAPYVITVPVKKK